MRYVWVLLDSRGGFRRVFESSVSGMAACDSREWHGSDEDGWWGSKDSDILERVPVFP
jgi:hypothetical protein